MSSISSNMNFDAIVIGAGPAGCATSLAHAQRGARVLLLEANPNAAKRLAGEWLHPGAVDGLSELGVDLRAQMDFEGGLGFAVFPDDGSDAIELPYSCDFSVSGESEHAHRPALSPKGWSGEHRGLVAHLRKVAADTDSITLMDDARVLSVVEQSVTFRGAEGRATATADRIIGADGRSSRTRKSLGLASGTTTLSRMAGLRLSRVELPFDGYGHVFLGGPGPVLAYRIQHDQVRLCIDLPSSSPTDAASLWDAYRPVLPESMRDAFRRALCSGDIAWAANQVRPRDSYGRPGLALIGDAVGFRHPLTAVGITLGIRDGVTLANTDRFEDWVKDRRRDTRVAEMLGGVLYEVFSQDTDTTIAMREGVFDLWRRNPAERTRTMQYISGEPRQRTAFSRTFARVTLPSLSKLLGRAILARDTARGIAALREIGQRSRWIFSNSTKPRADSATQGVHSPRLSGSSSIAENEAASPGSGSGSGSGSGANAIKSAVARLVALQNQPSNLRPTQDEGRSEVGGWEGEVAWCPMLAAQFVIFSHVMEIDIPHERRIGLLRHFEETQQPSGLWGLHAISEPYLFVTTLVYIASRLLGVQAKSSFLARAGNFIRQEDVRSIPSWGKLWLAIAGLYDWRGVPPVIPELFTLPQWLPFHPSKFYCHTRHIYIAMSSLYGRKFETPNRDLQDELRNELFDAAYEDVDWDAARRSLRQRELATPPSLPLRCVYEAAALFERHHPISLRNRVLTDLTERIRWELRATDHVSLSPVNGLLNILALWAGDKNDPDIKPAIERLNSWIWEDEQNGTRMAGARSQSWDTAFALRALAAASTHCTDEGAVAGAQDFLRAQQIQSAPSGFHEAFRLDPIGGWSFTNAWHAWPVSDCTAEAMEALLAAPAREGDIDVHRAAIGFVLRCQNRDGGFGSYEAKRSRMGLEWLNPAEMFGDSMTEHTYVECTGSCIAALATATRRFPDLAEQKTLQAVDRAVHRLRSLQRPDGAWQGVWAVHLIYGTLFGIRGLVAAGAPPNDPALRRARQWLLSHQRSDGGWGESHAGCRTGEYTENAKSQIIHTAWALLGLIEAEEPNWQSIERGAQFLIRCQATDGSWPRQDPAGLFFRTALLDYDLYRQYFPLWALSVYETRRQSRQTISTESSSAGRTSTSAVGAALDVSKDSPPMA